MEILIKSPAHPGKSLHDALAENRSKTLSVLLSVICDTFLPSTPLSPSFKAIESLEAQFRQQLGNIDYKKTLTQKELRIVRDASNGLYAKNDIEGEFYKHGGYFGIIALILYFRGSEKIKRQWTSIVEEFRAWLVKHIVKMLSRETVEWIPTFLDVQRPLGNRPLYYLGSHSGRKHNRDILETKATSGSAHALKSKVPSPKEHLPQQHRRSPHTLADQASNPHQTILRSSAFPCSSESSSSSIFLAPLANPSPTSPICPTNSPINPLSILICSIGCPHIRQDILFRGLSIQKRWNNHGKVHMIKLHDAGFDKQISCLFSSQSELEQTIESCIQLGWMVQRVSEDGSLEYLINDQTRDLILQSCNRRDLQLLGLKFITHIYPRDQTLEPSFQNIGKHLLPYLEHTSEFILAESRSTLPDEIRDSLVEVFLATNKLVGKARSIEAISILSRVQDNELPDYLQMAIANRESINLRFRGDHDQSDIVILEMLGRIATNREDMRSYCAYGRLLLSRAENAILRKDFAKAKSFLEVLGVKDPGNPSLLELQLLRMKTACYGRVSRYEGDFSHSRDCLEHCLATLPDDASRYHVMHHLGDIYCELKMPEKAVELVLDETNNLRARGKQNSKPFRRLALPLAEAYIQQESFAAAKSIFLELLNVYKGIVNHDIVDQLGHVRSMIGLARIERSQTRWSEARHILENTLVLVEHYRTFSKGSYYIGIIFLFLSFVNSNLHKYSESRSNLASAEDILHKEKPRHFIAGLGSYFLQDLMRMKTFTALRSGGES